MNKVCIRDEISITQIDFFWNGLYTGKVTFFAKKCEAKVKKQQNRLQTDKRGRSMETENARSIELTLKKFAGAPAARRVQLRRCTPAEASAVFALQNEVRARMPRPDQFVPDTAEQIRQYVAEDLCLGVWDGARLAAYFTLRYCGMDEHNYANVLGLPREEWPRWANADSAVVHPDYRGNGLQRRLVEAALQWLRPGIVGIGCTVSPENQYSLRNMQAAGYEIACRREMYGGYDRYVLRKRLDRT
jgi:GNAT superfamily N-acetyltransferase